MYRLLGILMCAGNATRFAGAKKVPPPYPKHLEKIHGKTILARAVESMVRYAGVDALTFTLNPQLACHYLMEISQLQRKYEIPFSFVFCDPDNSDIVPLYQLPDLLSQKYLNNPTVVVGHGDVYLVGEDNNGFVQAISEYMPYIDSGYQMAVGKDGGFIYVVSRLGYLFDRGGRFDSDRYIGEFGLGVVHINTPEDLRNARGGTRGVEGGRYGFF